MLGEATPSVAATAASNGSAACAPNGGQRQVTEAAMQKQQQIIWNHAIRKEGKRRNAIFKQVKEKSRRR